MTSKRLNLYHILREPSIKKVKSPALIMLHGYGSDANDLFSFASELPEDLFIISVQAPYPLPPYGNAWYAINFDSVQGKFSDDFQAIESRNKVVRFIDEAVENYPIDPKNITLLGFSQGTIISYAVALSFPERIKNVIALSGYINLNILEKDYRNNDFSQLAIYASHGTQDQVIPITWARKTPEILKSLKVEHTYSEFPIGHGVAPQNLMELITWIKNHI